MAQIKKRFIANNAIDGSKLQLQNGEAVRAKDASGQDVELFKLDASNLLQLLVIPRVSSDPQAAEDLARKNYVDSQVSGEASARQAADSAIQASLSQEIADRIAAVSAEQSAREAADAAESAARQAADSDLESKINVEKGRIDAILLASDADKDSFKEIVDLINSVDTENDSAFASYVLSNNAALAQEVSDRQAADTAEAAARQAADSAEQAAREAADSALSAALAQEVSDRQAADSAEQTAREAADSAETAARQAADATLQSNLDAETAARQNADAQHQANLASETNARLTAEAGLQSAIDAEVSARQAAVATEASARETADTNLQNQINSILSNTDPAALDSLAEVVAAFQAADSNLNNAISSLGTGSSSALGQEIADRQAADAAEAAARQAADSAEQAAREAADSALQNSLNTETSARQAADAEIIAGLPRFARFAKTVDGMDTMNGYVDLSHKVLANTTHVFVDRLALHEGDDYTLSTVNNVTRVTFTSALAMSPEAVTAGDLLRVSYSYCNGDQTSGGGGSGGGGSGGGSGGGGSGGGGSPEPYSGVALAITSVTYAAGFNGATRSLNVAWSLSNPNNSLSIYDSFVLWNVTKDCDVLGLGSIEYTPPMPQAVADQWFTPGDVLEIRLRDENGNYVSSRTSPQYQSPSVGGGGTPSSPSISVTGASTSEIVYTLSGMPADITTNGNYVVTLNPAADGTGPGEMGGVAGANGGSYYPMMSFAAGTTVYLSVEELSPDTGMRVQLIAQTSFVWPS